MRRFLAILISAVGLAACGAIWQLWATGRDARRYPPPGVLVDVGGRRLHLHCEGTGQPTVVLEASGFGNSHSYDRVLPEIAKRTRVCAYDRAGMGWSDPETDPLGFEGLEGDLDRLLAQSHEPPKYLLVAGSAGGLIALLYASHHPERVMGLVLLDPLTPEALTKSPKVLDELASAACFGRWAARIGLLRWLDPFGLRKQSSEAAALSAALSYRTAPWDAACAMTRDFRPEAARLSAGLPLTRGLPLRILSHAEPRDLLPQGHEDEARQLEPLWQELQKNLARQSEEASQRVVPESGHLIAQDRPDAVIAAISELLPRIPPRPQ